MREKRLKYKGSALRELRKRIGLVKSGAGFTLAELLIVIALIGVMTTIVIVNFRRGNYSNDLRLAGTELLQNLRLAQQYTIGGSSILFCSDNSVTCPTEGADCTTNSAKCKSGVPQGGYGIRINSSSLYTLFGDVTDNWLLDIGNDSSIIEKMYQSREFTWSVSNWAPSPRQSLTLRR
jgi:prepilin-type N-terminal cleavage/methylation domain-containing protein